MDNTNPNHNANPWMFIYLDLMGSIPAYVDPVDFESILDYFTHLTHFFKYKIAIIQSLNK